MRQVDPGNAQSQVVRQVDRGYAQSQVVRHVDPGSAQSQVRRLSSGCSDVRQLDVACTAVGGHTRTAEVNGPLYSSAGRSVTPVRGASREIPGPDPIFAAPRQSPAPP